MRRQSHPLLASNLREGKEGERERIEAKRTKGREQGEGQGE